MESPHTTNGKQWKVPRKRVPYEILTETDRFEDKRPDLGSKKVRPISAPPFEKGAHRLSVLISADVSPRTERVRLFEVLPLKRNRSIGETFRRFSRIL